MLVLSRFREEAVEARFSAVNPQTGKAEEVRFQVIVVDIRGDKVRLGFEGAPDWIPVHREEIWADIDKKSSQ
jgi:hypothetical protein